MSRGTVSAVLEELQKLGKLDRPRRRGRTNVSFDCPFHSRGKRQDTPSFGVHVDSGEWNCFNPSCGRKGPSVQSLYAALTGKPREEAEAIFPADLGATDDLRARLTGKGEDRAPVPLAPYPPVVAIQDSRKASAYMASRRIPQQVWDRMGASYCRESRMRSSLSDPRSTVGGERIVFPIPLPGGALGFMGRSVGEDRTPKWRPISNVGEFFYDPLGLLSADPGDSPREVVLVEGEFDVAACVREGLPALGCMQARLGAARGARLQRFDRILVMFDGDKAGRDGTSAALSECGRMLRGRIHKFDVPEGYDPAGLPTGFGSAVRPRLRESPSFERLLRSRLNG